MSLIPLDKEDFEPDPELIKLWSVIQPLFNIAEAYDKNELDDEARKVWGSHNQYRNTTPPDKIILYSGRGGKALLTLGDCIRAREAMRGKSKE